MGIPAVTALAAAHMRLGRARHHLDDFERSRQEWLRGLPDVNPLVTPSADDPSIWDVRFDVPPRLPAPFTLIVSDAVQNIRIALDYAAYSVVQRCGGDGTRSHFPYCREAEKWRKTHRKQLPNVGEPWLGLIRSHQPFTDSPTGNALGEIAHLSNVDKHQFLIPHYALTRFEEPQLHEVEDATGVEEVRIVGETGFQQGPVLAYRIRMSRSGITPPGYTYPPWVTYKFGQYDNGWPGPDLDGLRRAVEAADLILSGINELT